MARMREAAHSPHSSGVSACTKPRVSAAAGCRKGGKAAAVALQSHPCPWVAGGPEGMLGVGVVGRPEAVCIEGMLGLGAGSGAGARSGRVGGAPSKGPPRALLRDDIRVDCVCE